MKPLARLAIVVATALCAPAALAQELNCTVEFNTDQLSTNKNVFVTLQEAVTG